MNFHKHGARIGLLLTAFAITNVFAQKVQVGYDKSVDFSRYKSYTVAEPGVHPTRPLLYASIVGSIDHELTSKGFTKTQSDGDLILLPEGGTEFGLNQAAGTPISPTFSGPPPALNATMWTGAAGYSGSVGTYVPEGALRLDFIDRTANKVVWSGTVKVKLDVERKSKSLELVDKAVVKLLKEFPPKKN
jgi:hypothetical protein